MGGWQRTRESDSAPVSRWASQGGLGYSEVRGAKVGEWTWEEWDPNMIRCIIQSSQITNKKYYVGKKERFQGMSRFVSS